MKRARLVLGLLVLAAGGCPSTCGACALASAYSSDPPIECELDGEKIVLDCKRASGTPLPGPTRTTHDYDPSGLVPDPAFLDDNPALRDRPRDAARCLTVCMDEIAAR